MLLQQPGDFQRHAILLYGICQLNPFFEWLVDHGMGEAVDEVKSTRFYLEEGGALSEYELFRRAGKVAHMAECIRQDLTPADAVKIERWRRPEVH